MLKLSIKTIFFLVNKEKETKPQNIAVYLLQYDNQGAYFIKIHSMNTLFFCLEELINCLSYIYLPAGYALGQLKVGLNNL